MKRKLLLAALCVAGALGFKAQAQEDVTSTYLTNAGLSTVDNGWTYYSDTYKYEAWKTDGDVPVVEFYSQWTKDGSVAIAQKDFKFSQTITLPAGDYRIAVNAFYRNGAGDGTNDNKAWIFAGDKKQNVYALTSSGVASYTGADDLHRAANAFSKGDFSNAFDFSLSTETRIEVGFQGFFNTSLSWCILGPVKLYKYSLEDYLTDYRAKVTEATALYESPMNAEVLAALKAAVVEESSFSLSSEVTAAIATLTTQIAAANTSIANYVAVKAKLDAASSLDAAGQASYAANATVTAVQAAYDDRSIVSLSDEQSSAMDAAIIAAAKAQTTADADLTLALVNPSFENGFTGWTNNNLATQNNTSFEKEGNTYAEKWEPNGTFGVTQEITLLAGGVYRISAKTKARGVTSAKLFANGVNQAIPVGDATNTTVVEFACNENATFTFGFEGTGTGAGASWLCVDDFHMTYVGPLPDVEAVTGAMNADIAAAQTSAISAYMAAKTVDGYNAAVAAIAAAEASKAAYAKLTTAVSKIDAALTAATTATASTEDYNAIKTAYTNGTIADEDIQANIIAAYNAVIPVIKSQTAATADFTLAIQNQSFEYGDLTGWDITRGDGTTDTDVKDASNATYAATGSDGDYLFNTYWQGVPLTQTIAGLPNGQYTLTASVSSDGATIYLLANGEHNDGTETGGTYPTKDTFQNATITFLVKNGVATIGVVGGANGTAGEHKDYVEAGYWWYKADNFRLAKNRDLTEEEAFVAATEEDYAALNEAIDAHVLGFEAGEYAPYNNIDALTTLTAAKAIDQTANNDQATIQAATAAITGATWTANDAEVNAIWDGSFKHDYSTSGNVQPIAWHGVGNHDNATDVRWMWDASSNKGLEATSSKKGLFAKFTFKYGTDNGYTLPLKPGYYKLTFLYGGWNEQGERDIKVYAGGTNATISPATVKAADNQAHTTASSWRSYSGIIEIPTEGNYVLEFYRQNTNAQNQIVIGDIELVRATADDFKPQLAKEIEKANAVDVSANVGDAAFQIPASAATALTSAISTAQSVYNNDAATIDGVLQAVEDLQAAETTYSNVELNAPAADKVYNIVNVSTGYNYAGKAVTFKSASNADLTGNTTSMGYNEKPGSIYPQGVTFTAVEGVANGYILSYTRADGNTVYVGTGASVGYVTNGTNFQIRPTTDKSKAVTMQVKPTTTDGVWNLYNTLAKQNIGANGVSDQGFYTTAQFSSMKLQEAVNNEVSLNIKADNQYGTLIIPFNAPIPSGVTAYSVSEVSSSSLTLEEAKNFAANTPYIVYAENGATETLAGLGAAYTDDLYTVGLLTGTYTQISAPDGSYILQNHDGTVAFYQVDTSVKAPKVQANRAYLTYTPASGVKARALYFGGNATGIATVSALTSGEVETIYTVGGAKVQSLQKGLNILKLKNGETRKVFVK